MVSYNVKLTKTSDYKFKEFRKVSTIESLKKISEEFQAPLVVSFAPGSSYEKPNYEFEIEIYDDYRE